MKSFISSVILLVVVSFLTADIAGAQPRPQGDAPLLKPGSISHTFKNLDTSGKVHLTLPNVTLSIPPNSAMPNNNTLSIATPQQPKFVASDAKPVPPPFAFNMSELLFGSQGIGVQSCMYVTITNLTNDVQTMTALYTTSDAVAAGSSLRGGKAGSRAKATGLSAQDDETFTIPSPSHQMFPMKIQPHSPLTISVCFKPEKIREYKTRLIIKTLKDSAVIPVSGKGIKPEDVGKLPKTDMTIIKPKKKGGPWNFKIQLVSSSKVTLALFDELGMQKVTFLGAAFKNEGSYEIPFDGTDKGKLKLPVGKYYLRCVIEDVGHGGAAVKITKALEIK